VNFGSQNFRDFSLSGEFRLKKRGKWMRKEADAVNEPNKLHICQREEATDFFNLRAGGRSTGCPTHPWTFRHTRVISKNFKHKMFVYPT
jgi:hypothetical protein